MKIFILFLVVLFLFCLSESPSFATDGTVNVSYDGSIDKQGWPIINFNTFQPSVTGQNCDADFTAIYDAVTNMRVAQLRGCYLPLGGDSTDAILAPQFPLDPGTYYARYTSTGISDPWISQNFIVTPSPTPTISPIQIAEIDGGVIMKGDYYTENVSFVDNTSSSWVAAVDYGDGSTESINLTNTNFTLHHQYLNDGVYTVIVTIVNSNGIANNQTTSVNVAFGTAHVDLPKDFGGNWAFSNLNPDPSTLGDTNCNGIAVDPQTGLNMGGSGVYRSTSTNQATSGISPCGYDYSSGKLVISSTSTYNLLSLPAGRFRGVIIGNKSGKIWMSQNIIISTSPTIVKLMGATIDSGASYSEQGSFTDLRSTSWSGTVDYGDGSGIQPLSFYSLNYFSLNHTYNHEGVFTVNVTVTDNQGNTGTQTAKVIVIRKLKLLSPTQIYVSKSLLDLGVKFDLQAEVYKDNTLISSGEVDSIDPGGVGQTATETIPFNNFSPVDFPSGSQLKLVVSARNACSGSLLNSGTATLHYNGTSVDSNFGATIGVVDNTYHLLDNFLLGTIAGTSAQTVAVSAGAKCSTFKPFGTWTITP